MSSTVSGRVRMIAPRTSVHTWRWIDSFRSLGTEVDLVSVDVGAGASTLSSFVRAWWRGVRTSSSPCTVVHSMGTHGLLAAALPIRGRVVVVPWGSEVRAAARSRVRGLVARRLLRRADLVLTTSHEMARLLVTTWGIPRDLVTTISWGVDEVFLAGGVTRADVHATRRGLGFTEDEVVVIAPRGVGAVYRTPELLQAFVEAARECPWLRLVVIGDDVENDVVGTSAGALRSAGVRLLGRLGREELADLFRACDVVVSVPVGDQRSTAVLEALACGANLLVSDLPAYHEIAVDGARLQVVDATRNEALVAALRGVGARDDEVALANRAWAAEHERARTQFQQIHRACLGTAW